MHQKRLNLILLILLFCCSSTFATNPIPLNFEVTSVVKNKDHNDRFLSKTVKTIKRWFKSAKEYFQIMSNRGKKFLFAWLGLGALSVLLLIGSYVLLVVVQSQGALIFFYLAYILSLLLGVASFVFFILWLVDIIQTSDANSSTRAETPSPEIDEDRERRRKKKGRG